MASSVEYKNFILDQLSLLENITSKKMMGEYLLYCDGILFGGIYDNRLLVKKTKTNEKFEMEEELPYKGAKSMYFVEDVDDKKTLKKIVIETCKGL